MNTSNSIPKLFSFQKTFYKKNERQSQHLYEFDHITVNVREILAIRYFFNLNFSRAHKSAKFSIIKKRFYSIECYVGS